jgi:hypothetical protein
MGSEDSADVYGPLPGVSHNPPTFAFPGDGRGIVSPSLPLRSAHVAGLEMLPQRRLMLHSAHSVGTDGSADHRIRSSAMSVNSQTEHRGLEMSRQRSPFSHGDGEVQSRGWNGSLVTDHRSSPNAALDSLVLAVEHLSDAGERLRDEGMPAVGDGWAKAARAIAPTRSVSSQTADSEEHQARTTGMKQPSRSVPTMSSASISAAGFIAPPGSSILIPGSTIAVSTEGAALHFASAGSAMAHVTQLSPLSTTSKVWALVHSIQELCTIDTPRHVLVSEATTLVRNHLLSALASGGFWKHRPLDVARLCLSPHWNSLLARAPVLSWDFCHAFNLAPPPTEAARRVLFTLPTFPVRTDVQHPDQSEGGKDDEGMSTEESIAHALELLAGSSSQRSASELVHVPPRMLLITALRDSLPSLFPRLSVRMGLPWSSLTASSVSSNGAILDALGAPWTGPPPQSVMDSLTRFFVIEQNFPVPSTGAADAEDLGEAPTAPLETSVVAPREQPPPLVASLAPIVLSLGGGPAGWAPVSLLAVLSLPHSLPSGLPARLLELWKSMPGPRRGSLAQAHAFLQDSPPQTLEPPGGEVDPMLGANHADWDLASLLCAGLEGVSPQTLSVEGAQRCAVFAGIHSLPSLRKALVSSVRALSVSSALASMVRERLWYHTGRPQGVPLMPLEEAMSLLGPPIAEDPGESDEATHLRLLGSLAHPPVLIPIRSARPVCQAPVTITLLRPASIAEQRFVGVSPRAVATGTIGMARRRGLPESVVAMTANALARASAQQQSPVEPAVLAAVRSSDDRAPDWQLPSPSLTTESVNLGASVSVPVHWIDVVEGSRRDHEECARKCVGEGCGIRVRVQGLGRWLAHQNARIVAKATNLAVEDATCKFGAEAVHCLVGEVTNLAQSVSASLLGEIFEELGRQAGAVPESPRSVSLEPSPSAYRERQWPVPLPRTMQGITLEQVIDSVSPPPSGDASVSPAHTSLQSVDGGDGDVGTMAEAVADEQAAVPARAGKRPREEDPPSLMLRPPMSSVPPTPCGVTVGGGVVPIPDLSIGGAAAPLDFPKAVSFSEDSMRHRRLSLFDTEPRPKRVRSDSQGAVAEILDDEPALSLDNAAFAAAATVTEALNRAEPTGKQQRARLPIGLVFPPGQARDCPPLALNLPAEVGPSPLAQHTLSMLLRCADSSIAPSVQLPANMDPAAAAALVQALDGATSLAADGGGDSRIVLDPPRCAALVKFIGVLASRVDRLLASNLSLIDAVKAVAPSQAAAIARQAKDDGVPGREGNTISSAGFLPRSAWDQVLKARDGLKSTWVVSAEGEAEPHSVVSDSELLAAFATMPSLPNGEVVPATSCRPIPEAVLQSLAGATS